MWSKVHPRFIPPPYQDSVDQGRLILRDGTIAEIRRATPGDCKALAQFFEHLSPESRRHRFFSLSAPSRDLVAYLCDDLDPRSKLTLLAIRTEDTRPSIVAAGSYAAKEGNTAEVAFAVTEPLQGKGLGTLLLERLAILAVRNDFTKFWAVTHAENRAMREVFRESGFAIQERLDGCEIDVDLSIVPTAASVAHQEVRDRIATVASLRPFFRPRSVAVIGASRRPATIGRQVFEALVLGGFQGPIYPVNPKAETIGSLQAFSSVRSLPSSVDLAVIVVPRDAVLSVVDDCAAHGVRALVVISAGFAETGALGRELQRKLVERVRGHGMRMIGPNCMGLLNADPAVRLNATFSTAFPPSGRIAMSSQSGALGLLVLTAADRFGLGLSTFVSVGNKADVSGNDLLQYWEEDSGTDVILLYLESFGNPRRFARIARRVSRRKPIVALKSARTKAGGRAAGSHTAALAASEAGVEALFHTTGVIRAESLEEMFDLARTLINQPLPHGRRVAIITNAGGPGILCADACEGAGLDLPAFSDRTKSKLAGVLPLAASVANPIDMIASAGPEEYSNAIEIVMTSGEVDALVVMYVSVATQRNDAVLDAIGRGIHRARLTGCSELPVLACLMAGSAGSLTLEMDNEKVPAYSFPETAGCVLSKMATYAEWRSRPEGLIPDFDDLDIPTARVICQKALGQHGPGWLSAAETRALLTAFRLPASLGGVASTADEAVRLATDVGLPVAIKLASRQIVHKSEVGGVCLNVQDAESVRYEYEKIQKNLERSGRLSAMEGVVIQPMIREGVEVMVGVTQDVVFGPLIAFGLGGIHVEVLADVCFRVAPLTDRDTDEMVQGIRGYPLLRGYRGHPAADLQAIQELLLRVSRLVEEVTEITEVDLNPVFAFQPGRGCCIADARVRIESH
jgi:acetyl coenzyme A synthetase (ADP forming)-like protein